MSHYDGCKEYWDKEHTRQDDIAKTMSNKQLEKTMYIKELAILEDRLKYNKECLARYNDVSVTEDMLLIDVSRYKHRMFRKELK